MPSSPLTQSVQRLIAELPTPQNAAVAALQEWFKQLGLAVDPSEVNIVTLHYQRYHDQHYAVVTQLAPLPDAVLAHWKGESANDLIGTLVRSPWAGQPPPDDLLVVAELPATHNPWDLENTNAWSVYNGLYRQATPQQYNSRTHIPVTAEAFTDFIDTLDLHTHYTEQLNQWWSSRRRDYILAMRIAFIAACNRQVGNGSLSAAGQTLAWQVAGIAAIPSWASLWLEDRPYPVVTVRQLNLYGYVATDILCLENASTGTTLLYIPGNSAPFHEFTDASALHQWVAEQCRQPATRAALAAHFPMDAHPDGLSFSGLGTVMKGLAVWPQPHHFDTQHSGFATSGLWPPSLYVNYKPDTYSPWFTGDVFEALAQRINSRSYADADFAITTDAQASVARWQGYLANTLNLLGPLALLIPEIAPLLVAGGVAQAGLGIDQLLAARNTGQQANAVETISFGLLNAVPSSLAAGAKAGRLFTGRAGGFTRPARINGKLGYPLGPTDPPQLQAQALADYFYPPDPLPPLPQGDPAVAASVFRTPRPGAAQDRLQAIIDGQLTEVLYDLDEDAFVRKGEETFETPCLYRPASNDTLVAVTEAGHSVSDRQRMATLRALGIDLALPVELHAMVAEPGEEIPHLFSSLWVGDAILPDHLLLNLARNRRVLAQADYRYQLFLSRWNTQAFARNRDLLHSYSAQLQVHVLEDQPWYRQFEHSSLYPFYTQALTAPGRSYASAADILRYVMLFDQGGVYMDLDDQLMQAGQAMVHSQAGAVVEQADALASVALRAPADDLLLFAPLNHEGLGMHAAYNTSLIGSHAGNPVLRAISDRIMQRLRQRPDFYQSRPAPTEGAAFNAWARLLSDTTGPLVFNEVIKERCSGLYQLQQAINLMGCPHIIGDQIDQQLFEQVALKKWPFVRFAMVGHANSWASA
ncbi:MULTISPECIES: dermonecrotic toxin domain-containing protein [unclassified Pseudomonas]|uniref:dermonecrotic toxin domain-containing protein n=1 Tax=unclassified Pseudomonas TaxID=196821 RepID=UPI000BCB90C1|nr:MULTISPECIES: DUF6543 domain-containing protein [unclassified Pseudomonas]PVZ13793.1 glycosyl transferase-like sugar-binding protein [Pseudomonas sp. URIL14HWK12:I12]PVZ24099.1 glycosyl transferase-like sugar-binding protein [Pseudomonas sp. URIL14HWK12:I10]PVZ33262.1 glycosyl transferase-like sugar-binding protein [Pseudomonas sp. URIL14HWK12:I11]SNZ10913.1 Mannosyltransferase OCH1 and related enzymes [Pseudomonas sp. URIL14HWK12:I9]